MNRKNLSFFISFILLLVVIFLDQRSFGNMKEYTTSVDKSREIITSLEQLSNHFKSAQIYTPAYVNIKEKQFYDLYAKEGQSVKSELKALQEMVKNNPQQKVRLDTIERLINEQLPVVMKKNIAEIIQSGDAWRLDIFFQIHRTIYNAINNEKAFLANQKRNLERSTRWSSWLTIGFSFIAVFFITSTFLSNLFLQRKRKWLEGFLESVLNTSQSGIITCKAVREKGKIVDFKIAFANQTVEKLLGLQPDAIIGKKLSEIPADIKRSEIFKRYVRVVERGEQEGFELLYQKEDGPYWFYVLLAKLEDGITASFHDISEIKRYETELKENIKKLEHSNAELEQYAYAASHDLQEPLRKIRTFASQLKESQGVHLNEKGNHQIERILHAAERMSTLIKDILGFSAIRQETFFTSTDLTKIMSEVLEDVELLVTQKSAVIEYDPLPTIEAIPLQMHQLFYNLINNALKYSREGVAPFIQIQSSILSPEEMTAYPGLKPAAYCQIKIIDNGIGFDAEYSEQIFGLFKRLGDKQKYPGSGIGLSLCRKVVANHNGLLFARSEQDKGATFFIILPVHQTVPTTAPLPSGIDKKDKLSKELQDEY